MNSKRSMNTLLHVIKSPDIQGVLSGDLITHSRASLKRSHTIVAYRYILRCYKVKSVVY